MGVDRRPNLYDYWSLDTYDYTPWYHEMFPRNHFEIIYSTMFHVNSAEDEEATKKQKIDPFLNLLLQKFQNAFYSGQDLSLDAMVVK